MINKGIIDNIGSSYIETYISKIGLKRTTDNRGVPVEIWVNDLIDEQKINIEDFENFLFQELFFGKRKLIRVYQLDSVKKIKYLEDWKDIILV